MAPKKSDPVMRPNRVRFVLLEADLSDNNLSELTQAITQALKPAPAPASRYLPPVTRTPPTLNGNGADAEEMEEAVEGEEMQVEDQSAEAPPPKTVRQPRKQKYAVPEFKPDVDITGTSTSFKDFAAQQAPKSNSRRYLVAAIWMRDHGKKPSVNADVMYTCYRTASWPLVESDWDQAFRSLVQNDWMRRVSPGEYAITHVGEAALQKTGS